MNVLAMFQLQEIRTHAYWPNGRTLVFQAAYDSRIEEHQRFAKATPTAKLEMNVDNPEALARFELGKHYYFEISPAPAFEVPKVA